VRSPRKKAPATTAAEGADTDAAEPAAGERLTEDGHAGDDRERVREQRRYPRRGERAAALEAGLQDGGAERVARNQSDDEHEVPAALDGALRHDVSGSEEEPGGEPEGGAAADERR
jgi:hypothetical protein